MSAPGYQFTCTKCDFNAVHCAGRFAYKYQLQNGSTVWAPWGVGWCFDCKTIVEIQKGLSANTLESECAALKATLPPLKSGFFFRFFRKEEPWEVSWKRSELQEKEQLLSLISGRDNIAKCLFCGSPSVKLMEYPQGYDLATQLLPDEHFGCGGRLVISGDVRISYNIQEKILPLSFK